MYALTLSRKAAPSRGVIAVRNTMFGGSTGNPDLDAAAAAFEQAWASFNANRTPETADAAQAAMEVAASTARQIADQLHAEAGRAEEAAAAAHAAADNAENIATYMQLGEFQAEFDSVRRGGGW